jgi:predicted transcriptional regulator
MDRTPISWLGTGNITLGHECWEWAYTTTMTVCVRLASKGLLRREKVGRSYGYVYTATIGEQDFVARELATILDSIAREYPGALAQYLEGRRERVAS